MKKKKPGPVELGRQSVEPAVGHGTDQGSRGAQTLDGNGGSCRFHRHRDRLYAFFFFQAEDGIRYPLVTGVQTCALPILSIERVRAYAAEAAAKRARSI